MARCVLTFQEIDRSHVAIAGGKGAHLGELSRIEGIRVPAGFCITTDAFQRIIGGLPSIEGRLDRLAELKSNDRDAIRELSAEIRRTIEEAAVPDDIVAAIAEALRKLGDGDAYAVRSSATAEDSPTASFAGQQDTYLNVVGSAAVLQHVSRCWASLFTERAVTYRLRQRIDHRQLRMGVIVQRMVLPRVSGILFTADPVTGHRKVSSIEASYGLGEALVSGHVNSEVYKVRDDRVVARTLGGEALSDAHAVALARLGRRIEAHFGQPQDIEWCLDGDGFQFVQSRPITTLFPIPKVDDDDNHVYISVGHQQMMTDALKPLGISVRELTAGTTFHEAGGRQFVDVSRQLASPASRAALLEVIGKSDPLTGSALETILERGDFIRPLPNDAPAGPPVPGAAPATIETDPAIVEQLIARTRSSIATLEHDISDKSGVALLDFILADFQELKRVLFDRQSHEAIMAGMQATWWLNDNLLAWLGEKNLADTLSLSVPNNITSEMGLALLDVADAIRPHPEVVAFLENVRDERFLDELPILAGGAEARAAIIAWLDIHGMRCVGEIDITRPRWSERPTTLVPLILSNVRSFAPGEASRRFEDGRERARKKELEVLARLRALPDGTRKAEQTKRMIDRLRTFTGYREYPKYGFINRYSIYRRALLREAEGLVNAGVLSEREDIYYLTFPELHDVVRARQVDQQLIRERKDAFRYYEMLTPPRVLTSDGEAVAGAYRREDLPAGALVGLAVSSGTIEGRARVLLDLAGADVEPGDILVTTYTDPSWTPLFVAISGLVTEVGGLMTHGAVIAREYGLPAVVGVEHATRRIRDGQRIRVHGAEGYIELL